MKMLRSIQPLQFLLTLLAGWINRRQLEAIEYLKEENRLLKERLGGRRLRFTDAERRRLARRVYAVGRKTLSELDTLVTPDTLMRWYRTLVAQKWNYHRRGPGRPRTFQVITQLIMRMAGESILGYTRIQGALANLGHDVGRGTIANVLREDGIDERALTHYVAHYHEERNHQGLQNRLLKCPDGLTNLDGRVERRERLGGMLNFYHREVA